MPFILEATVQPSPGITGTSGAAFGGSYHGAISLSGGRLAVGAWGAERVAIFSGVSWDLEAELAPVGTGRQFFGLSLALSGELLAVGAPGADTLGLGSYTGAVYLFVRSTASGTWERRQVLTAPTPARMHIFGWHVALRGGTLAAGAYGSGSVHTFAIDESSGTATPSSHALLVPRDAIGAARSAYFGWSVTLSPDARTLLAAAVRANGVRGVAYVFERPAANSTAWSEVARLEDAEGAEGDRFGTSVAIDAHAGALWLLCGSKHKSIGGAVHNGGAFLYRPSTSAREGSASADSASGGNPSSNVYELAQLLAPPSADGALNGGAVAMLRGVAVIGPYGAGCNPLPGQSCAADPDNGRVFVYAGCAGLNCSLDQVLMRPSDGTPEDGFGAALALSSDVLAVSSPFHGGRGRVHVYRWSPPSPLLSPPASPPPQLAPSTSSPLQPAPGMFPASPPPSSPSPLLPLPSPPPPSRPPPPTPSQPPAQDDASPVTPVAVVPVQVSADQDAALSQSASPTPSLSPLSAPAIVGIVGSALVCLVATSLAAWIIRRRRMRKGAPPRAVTASRVDAHHRHEQLQPDTASSTTGVRSELIAVEVDGTDT